jgi:hypothetical protein
MNLFKEEIFSQKERLLQTNWLSTRTWVINRSQTMKILGLSLLFLTSTVFASNPLIRICNTTGGVFHEVSISDDSIGLCKYGSAYLDSLSVLKVTSEQTKTDAVAALESMNGLSCEDANATERQALDLEGKPFDLCFFQDGSVVESRTLQNGGGAGSNAGLMRAIQTRF